MKNFLLTSLTVILFLCTSAQDRVVRIEGHIKNAPDSMNLIFMKGDGNSFHSFKFDTTINGRFTIEYIPTEDIELPTWFSVKWMKPGSHTGQSQYFIAGEGVTSVQGSGTDVQRWTITNNTAEQKELNLINKVESKYYDQFNKYSEARDALHAQVTPQNKDSISNIYTQLNKEHNKTASIKSIDVFEMLSTRKQLTQAGLHEFSTIVEFGFKYGDYMKPYRERVVALYDRLTPQQKQSAKGATIYEILNPRKILELGDMLPSDPLRDTSGLSHTMAEYRGKYVLLDVWSSGCGPCLMAGDELRQMQAKYNNRLTIVGINVDDKSAWLRATKAQNVSWTNLSDGLGQSAGFCSNFVINGIPHYILADPAGKIIRIDVGYHKGSIEAILAETIKD